MIIQWFKKHWGSMMLVLSLASLLSLVINVGDEHVNYRDEVLYDIATAYERACLYHQAHDKLQEIQIGYKDVEERLIAIEILLTERALERELNYRPGTRIMLGQYEAADGEIKALEWIVLGKKENTLKLQCINCVASRPFFEGDVWKSTTLREWLNGDFLAGFSSIERQFIKNGVMIPDSLDLISLQNLGFAMECAEHGFSDFWLLDGSLSGNNGVISEMTVLHEAHCVFPVAVVSLDSDYWPMNIVGNE